uniref:Uncharacterized protein n=1 Tax=Populus trichocarpa TaxID=3694 RepID=A0A2K2B1Q2_POPTR
MLGTYFEERNLKLGFKKGEEGNLNFSCIHSLNLYPKEVARPNQQQGTISRPQTPSRC